MPSREPELYKDKVEVSLDGRQIFYLFFGGAVIVGMVFVLGVLVGRRVEARGHLDHARTTASADPLAALDRLEGSGGMAFRGALGGKEAAAGSPVETQIEQMAKKSGHGEEPKAKKADEKKLDAKPDEKKKDEKKSDAKTEMKSDDKKSDDKKSDDKKSDDKKKTDEKKLEKKTDEKKSDDKKSEAKADEPKSEKSRYTLQLSSFQDRAEAETFLASVKEKGYSAQITVAEVDGKGTFYRVRMGSYRSLDAATTAKQDFEKAVSKSASVMKI